MKRLLLLAILLAPLRLLALPDAIATPGTLSYQGKIANAGGALIGAGSPVNQDLTFRIWTSPTSIAAADRLWSEKITTTVSEGEFSVMLGSGDTVPGEANQRASFADVFAGQNSVTTTPSSAERYLGITIGTGTNEIFPRQKIVTTAFAFRAKVAESVAADGIANGQINTAQLAGTATVVNGVPTVTTVGGAVTVEKLADNAVTSAKILDGQVMAVDLASNAVTEAKIADLQVTTAKLGDNAVTTAKILNGQVTAAKLAPEVSGFWSTNSATPPDVYRATGKVGILTPSPVSTLTVGNGIIDSASSRSTLTLNGASSAPETTSKPGFYHRSSVGLGIFSDAHMSFQVGGAALIDAMFINSGGNVGLGTNTPASKLDVRGDIVGSGKITSPMFKVTEVIPYTEYPGTIDSPSTDANYVASGGTWLVTATISGFRIFTSATLTATLKVNDVSVGQGIQYVLQNAHAQITRQFVIRNKAAGTYKITWGHNGRSDGGDFQQVTIQELPY